MIKKIYWFNAEQMIIFVSFFNTWTSVFDKDAAKKFLKPKMKPLQPS